jgi:hypothetical protein
MKKKFKIQINYFRNTTKTIIIQQQKYDPLN